MSLPSELLTAALVGTDRAAMPPVDSFPAALAGLAGGLADRPPEEALLLLIGATALHALVGSLPYRATGVDWHLPAYRPEGDMPPCLPAASAHLERMLNQQDTPFLPEFLTLLRESGFRVPDALLPHTLEYGAKIIRQRPLLLPVLGERGRWLASLNPQWHYAVVDLADSQSLRGVWDSDPAGRPALAQSVRASKPEAARRLMEMTWRGETDTVRREMLGVLEIGLSMDDEPFLERALDDRDALVRRKAADLLAAIPGSRLVRRITTIGGAILVIHQGGMSPIFPNEISEAMMRDGISRHDVRTRSAGDWSRLLVQTVGAIPLEHWPARFGLEPEAIISAAQSGKWPRTLMNAFATAAIRQKDRRWSNALLVADDHSERTGMLLATLAPEDIAARMAQKIASGDDAGVAVFMRRWPHAWDENCGRMLIDFLGRQAGVNPDTRLSPTFRFLLRQFAHRCPPSLADAATETLGNRETNGAWQASLRHLLSVLSLRRELRDAVGKRPPDNG